MLLCTWFTAVHSLCLKYYCIYPKYWDTSTLTIRLMKFEQAQLTTCWCVYYWMNGKQCRYRSDAAYCGIWSGSTLFAQPCLSLYLRLIWLIHEYQKIWILMFPFIGQWLWSCSCSDMTTSSFVLHEYVTCKLSQIEKEKNGDFDLFWSKKCKHFILLKEVHTIIILSIGTDRPEQTV